MMTVFSSRLRAGVSLSFIVLQGVLWLAAVVALAVVGASVVAFAAAYLLVVAIISVLQVHATRRLAHIAWRAGRRLWRPLARAAIPLGLAGIMISIYFQVDSVLLLQIAGAREAGNLRGGLRVPWPAELPARRDHVVVLPGAGGDLPH